jgi:hypothetical protein
MAWLVIFILTLFGYRDLLADQAWQADTQRHQQTVRDEGAPHHDRTASWQWLKKAKGL